MERSGGVWPGRARHSGDDPLFIGLLRSVLVRCGPVMSGTVMCGLARCGYVRRG